MDRIIDATGGQYEGYNYLGAGILLLLLFAFVFAGAHILDFCETTVFLCSDFCFARSSRSRT